MGRVGGMKSTGDRLRSRPLRRYLFYSSRQLQTWHAGGVWSVAASLKKVVADIFASPRPRRERDRVRVYFSMVGEHGQCERPRLHHQWRVAVARGLWPCGRNEIHGRPIAVTPASTGSVGATGRSPLPRSRHAHPGFGPTTVTPVHDEAAAHRPFRLLRYSSFSIPSSDRTVSFAFRKGCPNPSYTPCVTAFAPR